ncbi:MAG: hypothetical protein IJ312_04185 [Treponema sp.]|nr:hypothetical protein [Treponema sp.]
MKKINSIAILFALVLFFSLTGCDGDLAPEVYPDATSKNGTGEFTDSPEVLVWAQTETFDWDTNDSLTTTSSIVLECNEGYNLYPSDKAGQFDFCLCYGNESPRCVITCSSDAKFVSSEFYNNSGDLLNESAHSSNKLLIDNDKVAYVKVVLKYGGELYTCRFNRTFG